MEGITVRGPSRSRPRDIGDHHLGRSFVAVIFALATTCAQAQTRSDVDAIIPYAGLSPYYLGAAAYPLANLQKILNGHLQLYGNTGSWATQTDLLSLAGNYPPGNAGNMGGYWDPDARTSYGGQDAGLEFWEVQARLPVATDATASYGRTEIATPRGNRTAYTVTLATPLTAAQVAMFKALPPNIRVETSSKLYAYLIPTGYLSPAGVALPPVSADGSTLVVDNWVRGGADRPNIPAIAGVVPESTETVSIDTIHQIDDVYGGYNVQAADKLYVADNLELLNFNERTWMTAINAADPKSANPLLMGLQVGMTHNTPRGIGGGTVAFLADQGWQAGFVARNFGVAGLGTTYGFMAPVAGPNVAFYSSQTSGWILRCDRGASGTTFQCGLDTAGNFFVSGDVEAFSALTKGPGNYIRSAGGSVSVFDNANTSQLAYMDGRQGNIGTVARLIPGNGTLAVADGTYGCSSIYLGAHFYVTDGRKPGESAGRGSGVPADCTPLTKGGRPLWVSVYDHAAVVN